MAYRVHQIAVDHGFRGTATDHRPIAEHVALIHSEVSEVLEDWRAGHEPTEVYHKVDDDGREKPCGIPIECADIIIRTLNLCGEYGIDIEQAIAEKVAFNRTRPWLHGGKRI
jgi:NTP pyrophosphatase (non-canonical NTP hydrolase)